MSLDRQSESILHAGTESPLHALSSGDGEMWQWIIASHWNSTAAWDVVHARVDWSPPDSSGRSWIFLTNGANLGNGADWETLAPWRPFAEGAMVSFVYSLTFGDAAGKTMTFEKARYRTTPQTIFPFVYDPSEWTDIPGANVTSFTVNMDDMIMEITPDFHRIDIIALYTVSPP